MSRPLDMTGRKFGKWTVLSLDPEKPANSICQCECGVVQSRKSAQLRWAEKQGMNQACIKCAGTRHGEYKSVEYITLKSMIDRCTNPNHEWFHRYGGRGISVCERWHDVHNFISDMGRRPSEHHSIDRINNDGNYEPGNCRWALQKTQRRNASHNVFLELNGKSQCIMDWSIETGLSHAVIRQRINNLKWSVEDALTITHGKACNWRGTKHKDAELLTYNGESLPHSEWAKRLGISRDTIRNRIKRGWTVEKAVTTKGR